MAERGYRGRDERRVFEVFPEEVHAVRCRLLSASLLLLRGLRLRDDERTREARAEDGRKEMILEGGVPLPETAGAHFTRFHLCIQRHMEYSVGLHPSTKNGMLERFH